MQQLQLSYAAIATAIDQSTPHHHGNCIILIKLVYYLYHTQLFRPTLILLRKVMIMPTWRWLWIDLTIVTHLVNWQVTNACNEITKYLNCSPQGVVWHLSKYRLHEQSQISCPFATAAEDVLLGEEKRQKQLRDFPKYTIDVLVQTQQWRSQYMSIPVHWSPTALFTTWMGPRGEEVEARCILLDQRILPRTATNACAWCLLMWRLEDIIWKLAHFERLTFNCIYWLMYGCPKVK